MLATIPMQLLEENFKGIKDKIQCDGVLTRSLFTEILIKDIP